MEPSQPDPRQQVIERLKQATNVLVTVSSNPSVDQLAACIGLTILLNKLDKHGTAVFSGAVPSTIEFLRPDETLEKTTDSLRDFIIALDKSKADHLRYKVEDKYVRIFITPYRASLSEKDLEFSQGDFNVDVVVALGVHQRQELDEAITAHGRILHDAAVISVNTNNQAELGSIHWVDNRASSLSEMLADIGEDLDRNVIDGQIATAFLTGIVAETDRFRNDKTTAHTMATASRLMSKGANQQLVAKELDKPKPSSPPAKKQPEVDFDKAKLDELAKKTKPTQASAKPKAPEPPSTSGTVQIEHKVKPATEGEVDLNEPTPTSNLEQIDIDDKGTLRKLSELPKPDQKDEDKSDTLPEPSPVVEPPRPSVTSATDTPKESSAPPLSKTMANPLISHDNPATGPADGGALPPPTLPEPDTQTLSQIEEAVNSPHLSQPAGQSGDDNAVNSARDAVNQAGVTNNHAYPPLQSLAASGRLDVNPPAGFASEANQVANPLPTQSQDLTPAAPPVLPTPSNPQPKPNPPMPPPPVPPPLINLPNNDKQPKGDTQNNQTGHIPGVPL